MHEVIAKARITRPEDLLQFLDDIFVVNPEKTGAPAIEDEDGMEIVGVALVEDEGRQVVRLYYGEECFAEETGAEVSE